MNRRGKNTPTAEASYLWDNRHIKNSPFAKNEGAVNIFGDDLFGDFYGKAAELLPYLVGALRFDAEGAAAGGADRGGEHPCNRAAVYGF